MTVEELYKKLKHIVNVGEGKCEILIVNRFEVPKHKTPGTAESPTEVAEVEQNLETIELADGYLNLLGKID